MPIPKPNPSESKEEFISRCMGNDTMNSEYPDEKQRSAVCYSQWGEKAMDTDLEKRAFNFAIEARSADVPEIVGHAAVFEEYTDIMWWRERVMRGAFSKSIGEDDVRALFNHDPNIILARNKNGTLEMQEDEKGLLVRIKPADTTWGRDLMKLIERGDISQMSFAFVVKDDEWTDKDGKEPDLRDIKQVKLYDVSPVTYPAYPQTDVSVRSYTAWKESLISRSESPRFGKIDLYKKRLSLKKRR